MRELNEVEIEDVAGGVVEGPDGGGCTDPRRPTEGKEGLFTQSGL